MDEPPIDDVLQVSTAQQYGALGHPTRLRLLFALGQQPATISQLAAALDSHKGNIAHHLKVLAEAGLVRPAHARQVRGGTERYFVRSARRFEFAGEAAGAQTAMAMRTIGEEMAAAPVPPHVVLRTLRLAPDQVERLTATLDGLAAELTEAGEDQPRYGLVLGLYQHRPPVP
jgi:DNA-binding transcriptional ArsR family regulator